MRPPRRDHCVHDGGRLSRGKFVAKGLLPTAPPADDLDPNATITVRIEDGGTLDQSRTFLVGECLPKGTTKVLCRSVDRQAKAVFSAPKKTPGTYKFTVKVGGLAIDPPFTAPAFEIFCKGAEGRTPISVSSVKCSPMLVTSTDTLPTPTVGGATIWKRARPSLLAATDKDI